MSRSGGLGGAAAELRRHAAPLAVAALLVVVGIGAVAWPGWGISATAQVAGGSSIELAATAADGSPASGADVARAAELVASRAKASGEPAVEASASGSSVTLDVPAGSDASELARTLAQTGSVEFVRSDTIADADALAQVQAGSSDISLPEGMYQAFSDGTHVRSASARKVSSTSGTTLASTSSWVVDVTLDDEGAAAFSDATSELASVRGQIAVVVDGAVVAAPSVSSQVSGNRIVVSGGLTEQTATALAAVLSTGALPVTLAASDPAGVTAALGVPYAACAAVAVALVAAAALLALARRPLGVLYVVPSLVWLPLCAGCLAALSHARLAALGVASLAGASLGFVALLCLLLLMDLSLRSVFADTARLRKAAASAASVVALPAACVAGAACAAAAAAWRWAPASLSQAVLALAAGCVSALACSLLVAGPVVRALAHGSLASRAGDLARGRDASAGE